MGMTIDEAIEVLEYLKTQNSQLKSIDFAIDTMRKYQMMQSDYEAMWQNVGLRMALKVIDKYKAESEDKE